MSPISRGFRGRRPSSDKASRLPPGQYETRDFPVLSAGPTPRSSLDKWDLTLTSATGKTARWTWDEFQKLPRDTITTDIHCVTKWSKFDTPWKGVAFDEVAKLVKVSPSATHLMCHSEYGFTSNLPLEDVTGTDDAGHPKAMLAYQFDGQPLAPEHGYPLRFFVPHLYFWKSAKWLRGLEFMADDRPGFWERNGYHMYGDPFREQRYWGD
jgi:DMSO/TMAO reductase YedYZ molybdopterin-dependent catalytic subunit